MPLSLAIPPLYIYPNSMQRLTERLKLWRDNMRNLAMCCMILFLLALNCEAIAPVQLTGTNGHAILSQLEGSAKTANVSTNASLWNWGTIPIGYAMNKSGMINPLDGTVLSNSYNVWTPSI